MGAEWSNRSDYTRAGCNDLNELQADRLIHRIKLPITREIALAWKVSEESGEAFAKNFI